MNTIHLTKSLFAAVVLALGTGGAAFAQTAAGTDAAAAPAPAPSTTATATAPTGNAPGDPSYGMLGSRYVGVDYGYLRFDEPRAPRSGHEFGADYNQPITPGLDFNAGLSDTSTGYFGTRPRTDQLLAGLTAYQPLNSWIKPFVSGQAGVAFVRDDELFSTSGLVGRHNSSDYFDYVLAAGAEFQVLPALVLTPFVSYQEIHSVAHVWNYGVKGTYRLTRAVSVSLSPQIDERHNLGYLAGVNFHF